MCFSNRKNWSSFTGASVSNLRDQISDDRVVVFVFDRFFWEDALLYVASYHRLLLFFDDICQEAQLCHGLNWF